MHEKNKRVGVGERLMAAALIVAGVAISALSLASIRATQSTDRFAQATPSVPVAPPGENRAVPAESTPGGTRPTTPAPEPARRDPDAQKAGAKPALPPAPAEKMAPPIGK